MKKSRWMKLAGILLAAALLLTAAANPAAAAGDVPLPFVTPSPLPTITPLPPADPTAAPIPVLPPVESIGTITENVVVALNTPVPSATESPVLYAEPVNPYEINLETYYANVNAFLLPGEAEQFAQAQDRWNSGERPETSVLNLTENVVIGVYGLPEEQYQGEKAFLLLPYRELTDDECLQIVDAYQQLGLTFDAASVSWRNCMRGGSIEGGRGWAGDEASRLSSLTELYKRSGLRPETPFTALPGDDGVGEISLNPNEYGGLDGYRFWPARRLTDEELLQIVALWTGDAVLTAGEYAELESRARTLLHQYMGMELSAERLSETFALESDYAVWGTARELYDTQFQPLSEEAAVGAWDVHVDRETNELVHAYAYCKTRPYCDVHEDPFADKWRDIALNWLTENRAIPFDCETAAAECMGEVWLQECGYGAQVRLILEDGASYTLRFHFEDGSLHNAEYSDAIRTANEEAFYQNEYAYRKSEEEVEP